MNKKIWLIGATIACCALMFAQNPVVNIDRHRHPNLANAQMHIVQACDSIDRAQGANEDQLGGHAARAKEFLLKADEELRLAANVANEKRR